MNSPGGQARDVGHENGEQGVAGDVERNAQEEVGRTLVELARELSLGHVELEERVAGRQSHVGDIGRVPGRDDQAPANRGGGIGLDRLDPRDQVGDLVDCPAVGLPATNATACRRPDPARPWRRPIRPRS